MNTDNSILAAAIEVLRNSDKVRIVAIGGGNNIDLTLKSKNACRCVRLALQDYRQNHLSHETSVH